MEDENDPSKISRTTAYRAKKKLRTAPSEVLNEILRDASEMPIVAGQQQELQHNVDDIQEMDTGSSTSNTPQQLQVEDPSSEEMEAGSSMAHLPENVSSEYQCDEEEQGEQYDDQEDNNDNYVNEADWLDDLEDNEDPSHDSDDPDEENGGNDPLYDGARLTVMESLLLLMQFIIQFKIPWLCVKMLIKLIELHLPKKNKFVRSVYFLRKFFKDETKSFEKFKCCDSCYENVGDRGCEKCNETKVCNFLISDIEKQLKLMFERESFRDMLMHRFNRKKVHPNFIEDVYDGRVYQKLANFFLSPFNISLMYFSDGVSLFKRSKFEFWPMLFIINELPFRMRFKPENVIFGGIWYGTKKPNFNAFLLPLYDVFQRLQAGINIVVRSLSNEVIKVRCIILNGTGDMPAKAYMINMHQHNGSHGCLKCLNPGLSHHIEGQSRVWVYPNGNYPLRNSADTICHGEEATNTGKVVYGMKGVTILSKLVQDFVASLSLDAMHSIFGGSGGKRLLELWFDKSFKNEPFSLYNVIDIIDERLLKLKPPNFVNRLPRSIITHFAKFETKEFKNWFFYYSIPLLIDIMPPLYFDPYLKLVNACYFLCQNAISQNEVEEARLLIESFLEHFQKEYGIRHMSANMHVLKHLPDNVLDNGPLWVTTCFPLEALNGCMVRMVNGTVYVELQISDSFGILQKVTILASQIDDGSECAEFIKELQQKSLKAIERIDEHTISIGNYKEIDYFDPVMTSAFVDVELRDKKLWTFNRLLQNGYLYVGRRYGRATKNISYCMMYDNSEICFLETFVKIMSNDCHHQNGVCECECFIFAVVKICEFVENEKLGDSNFIKQIKEGIDFLAVDIKRINHLCFLSVIEDKMYVAKIVNTMEVE